MANQQNKQGNDPNTTPGNKTNEQNFKTTPASPSGSTAQGMPITPSGGLKSSTGSGATGASGSTGTSGGTGISSTPGTSGSTGLGSSAGTSGGSVTGAATATARSLIDHAKETAGQAYEAVTDKAATKLDEQKSTLSGGLTTLADSVRQVSENLGSNQTDSGLAETAAKYTDTAARRIESMAGYFDRKSVRDMARDLEGFARRNPAIFLGAAFGLGLLAARFLKSTPPNFDHQSAGREFAAGVGTDHQLTTGAQSPNLTPGPM